MTTYSSRCLPLMMVTSLQWGWTSLMRAVGGRGRRWEGHLPPTLGTSKECVPENRPGRARQGWGGSCRAAAGQAAPAGCAGTGRGRCASAPPPQWQQQQPGPRPWAVPWGRTWRAPGTAAPCQTCPAAGRPGSAREVGPVAALTLLLMLAYCRSLLLVAAGRRLQMLSMGLSRPAPPAGASATPQAHALLRCAGQPAAARARPRREPPPPP
jgi:hypothetical protein